MDCNRLISLRLLLYSTPLCYGSPGISTLFIVNHHFCGFFYASKSHQNSIIELSPGSLPVCQILITFTNTLIQPGIPSAGGSRLRDTHLNEYQHLWHVFFLPTCSLDILPVHLCWDFTLIIVSWKEGIHPGAGKKFLVRYLNKFEFSAFSSSKSVSLFWQGRVSQIWRFRWYRKKHTKNWEFSILECIYQNIFISNRRAPLLLCRSDLKV